MGFLDKVKSTANVAKEKAVEAVGGHSDQIKGSVAKAGDFVDKKTKGKYSDKIHQGTNKVGSAVEGLAAKSEKSGTTGTTSATSSTGTTTPSGGTATTAAGAGGPAATAGAASTGAGTSYTDTGTEGTTDRPLTEPDLAGGLSTGGLDTTSPVDSTEETRPASGGSI